MTTDNQSEEPLRTAHAHVAEYPSRCEGCEHLAADLVSRAPSWMFAHWPTPPVGTSDEFDGGYDPTAYSEGTS